MSDGNAKRGEFNAGFELIHRVSEDLRPNTGPTGSYITPPTAEGKRCSRYFKVQVAEEIDSVGHLYGVPFRIHEIEEVRLKKVEPQPEDVDQAHVIMSKAVTRGSDGSPIPAVIRVGKIDYVLAGNPHLAFERDLVEQPAEGDLDDSFSPERINISGVMYIRADIAMDAAVKECRPGTDDTSIR